MTTFSKEIKKATRKDDNLISSLNGAKKLIHPELDPAHYYKQVVSYPYFSALVYLRHQIRAVSDAYFSNQIGAKNVDLFLMTNSISSPFGPGSDSEPIPITFGGLNSYLVDSSQFGFEPILVSGIPKAYCYLASMRGEDPDKRHLNQFYHCEYEAQENFDRTKEVAEQYVRNLIKLISLMPNAIERMAVSPKKTKQIIKDSLAIKKFPEITFDEAVALLKRYKTSGLVKTSPYGNDITPAGEEVLMKILKAKTPIWVKYYPRNRVPFYQKPIKDNVQRVLNADLLCPSLLKESFGGEILGMGQRQNLAEEIYESVQLQNMDVKPYEWYIDLRRMPKYKITSGFGLGIERFISWIFGFDSIHKAIVYPRMKKIKMNP
jgi:asparaginyl-tRNA synthetase